MQKSSESRRKLLTAEAKYLVTPRGGRIGKARQLAPFEIIGGSRHGNFDAIEAELEKVVRKWCRGTPAVSVTTTPVAGVHAAYVHVNNQLVGTLDVAAIEKEDQ